MPESLARDYRHLIDTGSQTDDPEAALPFPKTWVVEIVEEKEDNHFMGPSC